LFAILLWSAAGVLTGFVPAGAIGLMIACRVALGIGEAVNWPCAVGGTGRILPREGRGGGNGSFRSGASVRGGATTPLVARVVHRSTGEGWRALFVTVGAVGLVWAVLWVINTRGERAAEIDRLPTDDAASPGSDAGGSDGRTPFVSVFSMRLFWICLATGVCV